MSPTVPDLVEGFPPLEGECSTCRGSIHWFSSAGRWFHDRGDGLYDHRAEVTPKWVEARERDSEALDQIAATLDATEWQVDDLSVIADIVRSTGRHFRPIDPDGSE